MLAHRTLRVIASEAKQSVHPLCRAMDCFASLAMTTLCILAGASTSPRSITRPSTSRTQNANARDKPGHDVVFVIVSIEKAYAWLATVLPSAAWAAARRAIGTR